MGLAPVLLPVLVLLPYAIYTFFMNVDSIWEYTLYLFQEAQ
jgi:hypothetical protein